VSGSSARWPSAVAVSPFRLERARRAAARVTLQFANCSIASTSGDPAGSAASLCFNSIDGLLRSISILLHDLAGGLRLLSRSRAFGVHPATRRHCRRVLLRPLESAQYTSFRFTTHLIGAGIDASIGTVGDALDNALMESAIGLYKTELIKPRGPWRSQADVELATAEWIEWFNNRQLHTAIGDIPPEEYEANYYAQHQPNKAEAVTP
jgi:hypothetical protein